MNITPENTALIFVDLINDFKFNGGEDLFSHTEAILPNLVKLRRFAKEKSIPIIYVNDHYGLWQADFRKVIDHCKNKKSEKVIEKIKPDDDDYFLIKPQHSALFQTPLQSLLTELKRTHLILAGIAGDICILFTAKDAYMYKFSLSIPKNCLASEEIQMNNYALYLMESVMDADITAI
ncbi:isochorismatase family cysteine hydrolase [Oceanobacillus sp. J11TS1]|uniref:isochorismatase family cysteine hydrolase n=1 Tax=Oceanobacillus sp. J11TS1 TaxID=2807191 RepID=UPI001B214433|nr:isochorismatase family cysteine hydrolase [Oceanobacillus sp. J11TS1]GIO24276.1 putative isochorismatase family protein YaaI [Oceanobacillus sp. J11TS1]